MSTDLEIENEIVAKGLTAPRVTPDSIESKIATEVYFTAAQGTLGESVWGNNNPHILDDTDWNGSAPLDLLTFCVLILKNGFTVTGESACASPENFDADIGKKIARQNAIAKIWPLEGYVLRNNLKAFDDMPDIEATQTFTDAEALAQANS